jgi:hypothetical protein
MTTQRLNELVRLNLAGAERVLKKKRELSIEAVRQEIAELEFELEEMAEHKLTKRVLRKCLGIQQQINDLELELEELE